MRSLSDAGAELGAEKIPDKRRLKNYDEIKSKAENRFIDMFLAARITAADDLSKQYPVV